MTRLVVRASEVRRRYTEPPWDLRRLFGYPGQRSPGARVESLRLELLYGLEGLVKDDAALLRLAEWSSLLGGIPGRIRDLAWYGTQDQREAFAKYLGDWSVKFRRYQTRLGILSLWDPGAAGTLRLSDRVSYRLRDSAWIRYPFEPGALPGIPDPSANPPHSNIGLAGGVGWGFEAKAIYDKVFERTSSTSAELVGPQLSALGGWGRQKAGFDFDKTTITSETNMGRVSRYTVERIGRIGVLWTHARHVIVYERTVAPSRQFAAQQDRLLNRPVLRKVEEYVEFPHKDRSYPDNDAAPVSRGFILGATFPPRINVDSSWGSPVIIDIPKKDLGKPPAPKTVGWQLPLWSRDPTLDPVVYPKPTVQLSASADPETGKRANPATCDNPENLYFYTSLLDEDGKNTDAWPPVRGVDFPDLPLPRPANVPAIDNAVPDRRLPDATAVEPGYERFTIALTGAPRPTNVVAERAGRAMNATVRTVTMSRSLQTSGAAVSPALQAALDTRKAVGDLGTFVDSFLSSVRSAVPAAGIIDAAGKDAIDSVIRRVLGDTDPEKLRKQVSDAVTALKAVHAEGPTPAEVVQTLVNNAGRDINAWRADATKQLGHVKTDLLNFAAAQSANLNADKLINQVEKTRSEILLGISGTTSAADGLKRPIDQQYQRLVGSLRTGLEDIQRSLGQANQLFKDLDQQLDRDLKAVKGLAATLQGIVDSASRDAKQAREQLVTTVRARAWEIQSRVHEVGTRADAAVRSLLPGISGSIHAQLGQVELAAGLVAEVIASAAQERDSAKNLGPLFNLLIKSIQHQKIDDGVLSEPSFDGIDEKWAKELKARWPIAANLAKSFTIGLT